MKNWNLLGEAPIPGTGEFLRLYQGKDDFFIRLSSLSSELMSTRKHGSEDALGTLPCQRLQQKETARVLIGGLGMGFTLAAALKVVGQQARIHVAELIPEVVEWNKGPLGEHSGRPLDDPRTSIYFGNVEDLLNTANGDYDVIALDVDNGPEGLTVAANDRIYSTQGILAAKRALSPGGTLAYWSANPDRAFRDRLQKCGLLVDEISVFAHGKKGARHIIWLASGA
jgi:spermidine synthase